MYGNSFFNPYMYQPYYQASNLARGIGGISHTNNLGRASLGLSNTTTNNGINSLRGLLGKFSFSGFLNGASKTLNVVNQAIPIFYQVKPIFNNAKTMFRIMGAVKDEDNSNKTNQNNKVSFNKNTISNNSKENIVSQQNLNKYDIFEEENPTFFI